jgi:predicted HicB family RNase H-like nuclease
MEAKTSRAQQKAVNKYVKNNYDRFVLNMPKGNKERIKAHAAKQGESLNGFINRAISETMERDNSRNDTKTKTE